MLGTVKKPLIRAFHYTAKPAFCLTCKFIIKILVITNYNYYLEKDTIHP